VISFLVIVILNYVFNFILLVTIIKYINNSRQDLPLDSRATNHG